MEITKRLTTGKLSLLLLFFILFIMIIFPNIFRFLTNNFENSLQALLGLSISLVLFPFITIPFVHEIITKAANQYKIKVNKNLVKDYINACFIVFILAITEIVSIIIYFLVDMPLLLLYIIFAVLITMLIMLILLTLGLWQITKILYATI